MQHFMSQKRFVAIEDLLIIGMINTYDEANNNDL